MAEKIIITHEFTDADKFDRVAINRLAKAEDMALALWKIEQAVHVAANSTGNSKQILKLLVSTINGIYESTGIVPEELTL